MKKTNDEVVLCQDKIFRRAGNPSCPNAMFQPLVEKLQDSVVTDQEYETYGSLVLSLIEIITNNRRLKYQEPEVLDDCRAAMTEAILVNLPKYFDRSKGSAAYSYAFRIGYCAAIKVLERYNKEREFYATLREEFEEQLALENSAKKVVTNEYYEV